MIYGKFCLIDVIFYISKIKTIEDAKTHNLTGFIAELKKNKFKRKDKKEQNNLVINILEKRLEKIQSGVKL